MRWPLLHSYWSPSLLLLGSLSSSEQSSSWLCVTDRGVAGRVCGTVAPSSSTCKFAANSENCLSFSFWLHSVKLLRIFLPLISANRPPATHPYFWLQSLRGCVHCLRAMDVVGSARSSVLPWWNVAHVRRSIRAAIAWPVHGTCTKTDNKSGSRRWPRTNRRIWQPGVRVCRNRLMRIRVQSMHIGPLDAYLTRKECLSWTGPE